MASVLIAVIAIPTSSLIKDTFGPRAALVVFGVILAVGLGGIVVRRLVGEKDEPLLRSAAMATTIAAVTGVFWQFLVNGLP